MPPIFDFERLVARRLLSMKQLTRSLPVLLAVSLQVLPLLRHLVLQPANAGVWAFILRAGIGAGAVVGSVDAVSGATIVNGPVLVVDNVPAGLQVTNALFSITGTVVDPSPVNEVVFNLNNTGSQLANSADGYATWQADISLLPAQNVVQVYAMDINGTFSLTSVVGIYYVALQPLLVSTNGRGSITPRLNGAALQVNQAFSVTATPATGFVFTKWTDANGAVLTNGAVLNFKMATNLALTANFVDVQKPAPSLANLRAGGSASNALFTVRGATTDNDGVAAVLFNLNNGGWLVPRSTNQFTNWWADVTLVPGKNALSYYAVDNTGNVSATNAISFSLVWNTPLLVSTNGSGSVVPNYNHALLSVSNRYTMAATPATGFAFKNWTDGNGNVVTNKPTLAFIMASNISFTANFVDVVKPTLTLTNPAATVTTIVTSNEFYVVSGKAADNGIGLVVLYSLNNADASQAYTEDGGTDWKFMVNLQPGTNNLVIYAQDSALNISATNKIKFIYQARGQSSLNGLDLSVLADGSMNESQLSFGATTFNLYTSDTNSGNAVGTYTYFPRTHSNGVLVLNYTAPPSATSLGTQTISLSFNQPFYVENAYGRYTNGLDTGGLSFFPLTPQVFPTLLNQSLLLVNDSGAATWTQFGASQYLTVDLLTGITNRGPAYTNNIVSPVGALTKLGRTNGMTYLVTTWLGTNYGWAFVEDYSGTNLVTQPALKEFCLTSQRASGNAPLTLNNHIAQFGLSANSERWVYFNSTNNFVDLQFTPTYSTNGLGTYVYTRISPNAGRVDLKYTSPAKINSLRLQFVAPNFSIYTNTAHTISTVLWR